MDVAADSTSVRVAPASGRDLSWFGRAVGWVTGRATSGEPPHIFTTLARHRRLFRWWLPFAGSLLLRSDLPRRDVELVILRTAWRCASPYEWVQHDALARRAGLGAELIARVASGPDDGRWSARQRALLRATDQLLDQRVVDDATWSELAAELRTEELIELCMRVGHYEMVAVTLNSLGVTPEASALAALDATGRATVDALRARLARARSS